MATSTPIASVGRSGNVGEAVRKELLPDYDIVHMCQDAAAAEEELPLICSGHVETAPSSGVGTNAGVTAGERRVPKIVTFGGAVGDDEVEKITTRIQQVAPEVRFVRIQRSDLVIPTGAGPLPESIAKALRRKLDDL